MSFLAKGTSGWDAELFTQAGQTSRVHACRGAVRLYADFYQSDIIVASPLALATALQEAETEGGPGVCTSNLCHVGRHVIVKPEWDGV